MKKVQQEQLKNHHQYVARIEALISSIGEGLIATDEKGLITSINKPALNMFGYKKSEILNKRFTEKIQPVYESGTPIDIIDSPIARAFLTGQVVSEQAIFRGKMPLPIAVQVTVSPFMFRNRPVGAVQLFRDISKEVQMDKMKSDFISLASHQLRTPLSSVNIYAGMLKDGIAGKLNPRQRDFAVTILESAQRMNELIDKLLNITRIEAGGIELDPSKLDIYSIIAEVVNENTAAVNSKNMTLKYAARHKPVTIRTDVLLVKEVIANLVTNAVKYTPEKGTVTVSTQLSSNNLIIKVADNGYGIPKNLQKYIFSKFFRADNILNYDVSGTGLGLYLTKKIAEILSGDIWFESEENKGTTFFFSLPIHGPIAKKYSYLGHPN